MGKTEFSSTSKTRVNSVSGRNKRAELKIRSVSKLYSLVEVFLDISVQEIESRLYFICSILAVLEYKYLSWVYGVDRKICQEGY